MAGSTKVVRKRRKAVDAYSELLKDPRIQKLIDGHAKGLSYRQMAVLIAAPGTEPNPGSVSKLWRRYNQLRRQVVQFDAEHEVANEARGYQQMELEAWQVLERAKANNPNHPEWEYDPELLLKAEETLVKIKAAKAKLLGLNAPDRVTLEHQVDGLGAWIAKMRSEALTVPGELIADSPLLLAAHNGNGAPSASGIPDALAMDDEPEPQEPVQ